MKKISNANLRNANKVKNDEFYTQRTDIEKELSNYKSHFEGKVVFCNCDDPRESNFVRYFSDNFEHLKLKKLIATHYKEATMFTQESPYKLEYTGDKNNNRTADDEEFTKHLIGDGDFRSQECIELLKEADIVVTNPPFSLFREYVAQLVEYDKKFLIIGNKNAITYKEIFKLIKENKIWLGYGSPDEFILPNNIITKQVQGLTKWYTNLEINKIHEDLILVNEYYGNESKYPKYDNYDAINIDKTKDIPCDYKGAMGVPITFLDKYNPDQFEIIKFRKGDDDKDLTYNVNGESRYPFFRIVIKNKKVIK